jgi:hypothetical protein
MFGFRNPLTLFLMYVRIVELTRTGRCERCVGVTEPGRQHSVFISTLLNLECIEGTGVMCRIGLDCRGESALVLRRDAEYERWGEGMREE